jgi:uncharacterized protein with ParB-like and HNH nuclease domain
MQAYSMPFSKIIDVDQGARDHFHVPKYQREYAWGRKEWEQLLADVEENDPGSVASGKRLELGVARSPVT